MTVLRGPADADHFRVTVGRFKERWYHDPLPACDLAGVCEQTFPSVSTVKKASGSDWTFVGLKRVNAALDRNPQALLELPFDERYDALKSINQRGLEQAAKRGTNVHLMAEARLYGRVAIIADDAPGANYRTAVDQFFDQYQPTLVAAEMVCIHRTLNGVGYGGTSDAIVEIDGQAYLLDWKSRGEESEHGCYPEEAAQLAAYALADYMIIEGDNGPERAAIPQLAGGLIVSIKPDGARVYPVDLDKAFTHWTSLHGWWTARRSERDAIGRQWAPRKTGTKVVGGEESRTAQQTHPPTTLVPSDAPSREAGEPQQGDATSDGTTNPCDTCDGTAWVKRAGLYGRIIKERCPDCNTTPTTPAEPPSEGSTAHAEEAFDLLRDIYTDLTPERRAWIADRWKESHKAGVSFRAKELQSERRYFLIKALCIIALVEMNDPAIVAALIHHATGEAPTPRKYGMGEQIGRLNHLEAKRFFDGAEGLAVGRLCLGWPNNTPQLKAVAA